MLSYDRVYNLPGFDDSALNASADVIQKTRTTRAGNMAEIRCWPEHTDRKISTRIKSYKLSTEAQQKLNDKNARRKLALLINANFGKGDYWGTFGWDNGSMPIAADDVHKQLRNFFDRLKRQYRKAGILKSLRYVYVIEQTAHGFHVHVVMSGDLNRDIIEGQWKGGGYPQVRRLRPKDLGGLTGMAAYIAKCPEGRRRWGQSKGLKRYTRKPTESYSKITKRTISRIAKLRQSGDEIGIKAIMERAYPSYTYDLDYPAELYHNDVFGGLYLFCRMYRPIEGEKN